MEFSQPAPAGPRHASELKSALPAVLAEFGHRCPGTCQAAAEGLDANVWFTRRNPMGDVCRNFALVVIDTTPFAGPLTAGFGCSSRSTTAPAPTGST